MDGQTFYAVKHGRRLGICYTVEEYKKRINGFQGAWGDEFETRDEALKFLGVSDMRELRELEEDTTNLLSMLDNTIVLYVDGSYYPQEKVYGGAFVAIKDCVKIADGYEPGNNQQAARNLESLAGELQATMLGVRYAVKNGYKKAVIHYDNEEIAQYGDNKKEAKHVLIKQYMDYINAMREKHSFQVEFVKVKAHKGNVWNEYVDKLAKKAAKSAIKINSKKTIDNEEPQSNKSKKSPKRKWRNEYKSVYKLYKSGHTLSELATRRGVKERKAAISLMRSKLDGHDIDINSYFSFAQKLPMSPNALTTYDLYKKGFSFNEMMHKAKFSESTILKHLLICFTHFQDVDLNSILSGGNYKEFSKNTKAKNLNNVMKKTKGSHNETYELFMQGHSIREIATKRGLKDNTIYGHLAKCYEEGQSFNINELVEETHEEAAIRTIEKNEFNIERVRKVLPDDYPYGKVMLIKAKYEHNKTNSA